MYSIFNACNYVIFSIINDIYDILSSATPNSAIEEEEAAEFAEADEAA